MVCLGVRQGTQNFVHGNRGCRKGILCGIVGLTDCRKEGGVEGMWKFRSFFVFLLENESPSFKL